MASRVLRSVCERYGEDAKGFGISSSLYSSVVDLLIRELNGSRMLGLTSNELIAVASCLCKATEGNYVDVGELSAWSKVLRETSKQLSEGEQEESLMHAIVVVVN